MARGVVIRDKGWNALKKRLENARSHHVRVGVQGPKGQQNVNGDFNMVRLAGVHEFGATIVGTMLGTITIPQRSFIRDTVDIKRSEIGDKIAALVKLLTDGRKGEGSYTIKKLYGLLGLAVESMMKGRIEEGIPPRLSDFTLAHRRNGGSKPLLDTGKLRDAITWEIHKEGEAE